MAYVVFWYMMDKWITPLSIIFQFIVIMSGITYAPAYYTKYEGVYTFPDFAEGLGWLMVVSPLALIVGGMIVQSIRYGGVSTIIETFPINFPLVYSRTYDLITISIRAWLLKKPEVWLFLYNLKRIINLVRIKMWDENIPCFIGRQSSESSTRLGPSFGWKPNRQILTPRRARF